MQINTFKTLFLSLFLAMSFFGFSSENKESESTEDELDITEMILHHVSDSHNFHILDWNGHPVSIPLPVILWTNEGLVTFMSSEFHHDEEGKVVVEKKGQKLVNYHSKI